MSGAEEDARDEMTLRPKAERRMGVAEVSASGDGLLAIFVHDLDFLNIVRSHRLKWDPDVLGWRGKFDEHGVPATDQIAELAAALLAEGFSVMVSDDGARKRAQAETNEPNWASDSPAMTGN